MNSLNSPRRQIAQHFPGEVAAGEKQVAQNQVLANIGLTLTMMIVVAILYFRKELSIFKEYFVAASGPSVAPGQSCFSISTP